MRDENFPPDSFCRARFNEQMFQINERINELQTTQSHWIDTSKWQAAIFYVSMQEITLMKKSNEIGKHSTHCNADDCSEEKEEENEDDEKKKGDGQKSWMKEEDVECSLSEHETFTQVFQTN